MNGDDKTYSEVINPKKEYWEKFREANLEYMNAQEPQSYFFCNNKKDADDCADLVVQRIKQATSTSVWWFEKNSEKLPRIGDIAIVTNWDGCPKAIVRTTRVEVLKFKDTTPEYAYIEGEGDRSLQYWKKVHWDYYESEMKEFGEYPFEEMEIICEYFETIW